MSRDPMAVLSLAASMAECGVPQAEVDEAIAQVEALVEAMRNIERMRPGTPTMDMWAKVGDPKAIAYRYQRVAREALAPFTAGQDSEGAA